MKSLTLVRIEGDGTVLTDWPIAPELRDTCTLSADWYKKVGFQPPWVGYFAFDDSECIGACGFKTAPRADGTVEIAYGTVEKHRGKGYAKLMARHLIELARKSDPAALVIAQTLPDGGASCSVLKSLGFTCIGEVQHPEDGTVWEWHLK